MKLEEVMVVALDVAMAGDVDAALPVVEEEVDFKEEAIRKPDLLRVMMGDPLKCTHHISFPQTYGKTYRTTKENVYWKKDDHIERISSTGATFLKLKMYLRRLV